MPRMSRASAYAKLSKIEAAARDFLPDPRITAVLHAARAEHDYLDTDRTNLPNARAITEWSATVAEFQATRLFNSATIRPMTSPATVVYLFGAQSSLFSATEEAAALAAQELSVSPDELRLVDHTPVSTATWTGARYTFRVRAAWDPAPAPQAAAAAL